jgi:hypothetical protein
MLADEKLTPNQVAELDRQWSITTADAAQAINLPASMALDARLQAQVQLQRQMIDAPAQPAPAACEHGRQGCCASCAGPVCCAVRALQDAEHATLPKHLLTDFVAALNQTRAALAAGQAKVAAALPLRWRSLRRRRRNGKRSGGGTAGPGAAGVAGVAGVAYATGASDAATTAAAATAAAVSVSAAAASASPAGRPASGCTRSAIFEHARCWNRRSSRLAARCCRT